MAISITDEVAALELVKGCARSNRLQLSRHARMRMALRHASLDDLREVLATATRCEAQGNDTWRVCGGTDRDGDELTVIVVIDDELLVVTLF